MEWETPSYVELKMDAEIGAYQDDFDRPDCGRAEAPSAFQSGPATRSAQQGDINAGPV